MEIKAIEYNQKDKKIYVFVTNPYYIRRLMRIGDISKSDNDFQRPYDIKRVQEIKRYILGKDKLYKKGKDVYAIGYMPNAVVINLNSKYRINRKSGDIYIEFPDEDKIIEFENSIEIIDGQHRLLAFDQDCMTELGELDYKMCFVALIDLNNDEKKQIFMVLNERQQPIDKNILLRQKKLLNLLLEEEETRYEIITQFNSSDESPYKSRIIMAGEKIKYGLKATQMDNVLDSSKALESLIDANNQINENNKKLFNNYFIAWSNVFRKAWNDSGNTLKKIAGFRFMCYLFPYIYQILKKNGKGTDFRVPAFEEVIVEIRDNYFDESFDIKKAGKFELFQERSGIANLAKKIGRELTERQEIEEKDILV